MGLNETVFGSPGQTQVHQTAGSKPPGFNFARDFFNSLGGIAQNPYPTYQGQLDPGLSPTMQNVLRQAQGYAQSGPPEILAGVQGSLGRFMNPNFTNTAARFGQGYPDYFNQNPNQTVYNGGAPGGLQGVFGAQGPAGMGGPKPPDTSPTGAVGFNGSAPPGLPAGGPPGGKAMGYGQDGAATPMPGGQGGGRGYGLPGGGIQPISFDNPAGGYQPGGWGASSGLNFPGGQNDMLDFASPGAAGGSGGGLGGVFGGSTTPGGGMPGVISSAGGPAGAGGNSPGGWLDPGAMTPGGPNTMHPPNPATAGGQGSFGGYSIDQLQHDPGLAGKLGPHAAALWRAFGGGQGGGPNTMHPLNPGMPHRGGPGGKPMRDPRTGGIAVQPPPVPGTQYGGPGTGK